MVLAACAETAPELTEGQLLAPECRYEFARDAAAAAVRALGDLPEPQADSSNEDRIAYEEIQRLVAVTRAAELEAEKCEARVREWSDLAAQWQSARASANMVRLSNQQIVWTAIEIGSLLLTVAVGVGAILAARASSNRDFGLLKSEVDAGRADSSEQARRFASQLLVAQEAATAAKESISAYRMSERAWVGFIGLSNSKFSGSMDGNPVVDGLVFSMEWMNTGRTPALDVDAYFQIRSQPYADNTIPVFQAPVTGDEPRKGVIVPNMQFSSAFQAVDTMGKQALLSRQTKLIVYGRVTYRDAFLGDQLRVTECCYEGKYAGDGPLAEDGTGPHNFQFVPIGPQNLAV